MTMNTLRTSVIAAVVLLCPCAAHAIAEPELQWAARTGQTATVATLLAAGADANGTDPDGMTPLHFAAMNGQLEAVRLLLAAGADLHAQDSLGRAPLHYAAFSDNTAVLDALRSAGADARAADHRGETPLHLAARRVKSQAVCWFIAAGADVNARNMDGETPLHVLGAAGRDVDEVAALVQTLADVLIARGADPHALDRFGVRAWPHAQEGGGGGARQPSGYPSYTDILNTLTNRANTYPTLCQLFDLGPTAGSAGRRIWALKISDNVSVQEDEPELKYIANMHGDEVTGLMMCLNLIDYLLGNYGTDPRVTNIVDELEVWIIPTMNPDGYMSITRYNAHGEDLNRNFPEGSGSNPEPNTTIGREPETADIMNWSFANSFTLAANFHGGALVVNYPFDNDGQGSVFSPTLDEDLFVWISEQYSSHNSPMWNSTTFYHGITNGAAWYAIDGGMQDWDYRYMGGNEVTIELGPKTPAFSQIPTYWNYNRESMLYYMETCLTGVRGIVTAADTGLPLAATITVLGRDHKVYTDPDVGDYHRMLRPGTYQLQFQATGYDTLTASVTVSEGPATRLDVLMSAPPHVVFPNGGETLTVNVPTTVTWQGSPAAQFQVQQSSDYGQTGSVVEGFESGMLGSMYATGGSAPWYVASGVAHTGTYAARAGAIAQSQTTWMTRTAQAGALSFWYKVSSEASYDWFNFYIDGVQKVHKAGNVNWTLYSTTLATGTHTLKWEYVKDSGLNSGSDTAWIDDLSLTGDATTWSDIVALTPVGATATPWTPATVSTTCKVRVRACFGGGSYGGWDESDGLFTVQQGPTYPKGDMNCDLAVDFGDINPFILALTDPVGYGNAYPGCPILNGDINEDGSVDFGDINPFIAVLAGRPG
jgi:hypothetical protein